MDQALRYPGGGRDLAHRGVGNTLLGKDRLGGGDGLGLAGCGRFDVEATQKDQRQDATAPSPGLGSSKYSLVKVHAGDRIGLRVSDLGPEGRKVIGGDGLEVAPSPD